ncbi:zinc-binding dehydrogenase, partial [Vibrio harveyi]
MLVEPDREQFDTLLYMVGVGLLKTEVQHVYPMTDVIEAHKQVESGRTRGKILLDMTC